MILSDSDRDADDGQKFIFARVLGIFHANIVHGESMHYRPRRIEFLWVRWFQSLEAPAGWENRQLDLLSFPLIDTCEAFGFLDPANIVRACHIIPRLALGKKNEDGRGVSYHAKDAEDWRMYYVNR